MKGFTAESDLFFFCLFVSQLVRVSRADTVVTVLCDSDPSALSQPVHVQKINPELSTNSELM